MVRRSVARRWHVLPALALLVLHAAPASGDLVPEDVARGKPATASTTQSQDHRPQAANDGDPQTRWCASDGSAPQWWQVDLERPQDLTGCRLAWESERGGYRYKIEGSADGRTWRTLIDRSQAPGDGAADGEHTFSARAIRHVRVAVSGLPAGQWASLFDVEIYGTRKIEAPARAARPRAIAAQGLLAGMKVPPGFRVTLFAAPPDIHYPTCLVTGPAGEVYVGVDENGSIDAKPDRGRVVRCVDSDGDGKADRFNVFARMDSPRGLVLDGRTLYVLHPPFLTAYHDDDGDGTAERAEDLVKGLGFDLKFRGADHTTNGIQLGIDGWLYVAVGDYGFVKAEGRDGTTRQLRGGGVVRVRPDGTGLEVFARGTRNLYDVAIDPLANVFTRDNTNDGGGWNVRLSHIVATGNYGYPCLFTNFPAEIVPPLADYGGGSPTGSLYVQEAALPPEYGDTLYTCDWGRSVVYRHPLTASGAGFKADQVPFIELPRPTDIDVDDRGNFYIATWRDGGFTYSGPNVGYVVRTSYDRAEAKLERIPASATQEQLLDALCQNSHTRRVRAQRALLARGGSGLEERLAAVAASEKPLAARVAAIFGLAQLRTPSARNRLVRLAEQESVREFALRGLGDRTWEAAEVPAGPFVTALRDRDPRVRLQAVVGLGRLGKTADAKSILPLTADGDGLVAHAAVKALAALRAVDTALDAVTPDHPAAVAGACRVLQEIPEERVVAGLIGKLALSRDDAFRRPILEALCRLHYREADWQGQWWGTRPDTSGPYYQPVAWAATEPAARALRGALEQEDSAGSRWLLGMMIRNKIDSEELTPLIVRAADQDPGFRRLAVGLLAGRPKLNADSIRLLASVAESPAEPASERAKVVRSLQRHANAPEALASAVRALAPVGLDDHPDAELLAAWRDFARDPQHGRRAAAFRAMAHGESAGAAVLASAVLLHLANHDRGPERLKREATDALAGLWKQPATASALLRAAGRLPEASMAPEVRSRLNDNDPAVRAAARFAAKALDLGRDRGEGPPVSKIAFERVVAGVLRDKGDPALGAQLFQRQGCVNCHTVSAGEPLKGPLLAGIAARYSRTELTESILRPSARIAQGFETQKFATADGRTVDGFVVRESGAEVELRTGTGAVVLLKKDEIEERAKADVSVMPNGLADPLTVHELASILGYLESLKAK